MVSTGRPGNIAKNSPWFDDLAANDRLSAQAGNEIAKATSKFIFGALDFPTTFSQELREDQAPRIVFLSVSNGLEKAKVFLGRGYGILAAWRSALLQSRFLLLHGYKPMLTKLDIVTKVRRRLKPQDNLIGGIDGLAFDSQSQMALLDGQLLALKIIDNDGQLNQPNIDSFIKQDGIRSGLFPPKNPLAGYIFATDNWLVAKESIVRIEPAPDTTLAMPSISSIDQSINLMSEQFGDQTPPETRVKDVVEGSGFANEVLDYESLSLTILATLRAYDLNGKSQFLRLARKHLDKLLSHVINCPELDDGFLCAESGSLGLIQQNSLLVLAISSSIERTKIRSQVPILRGLANSSIRKYQGSLSVHSSAEARSSANPTTSEISLLLYALTRAIDAEHNQEWSEAAISIANHLADSIESGQLNLQLERPLWLAFAFENIFQQSHNSRYKLILSKIVASTIDSQVTEYKHAENIGSFRPMLSGKNTAEQLAALLISKPALNDKNILMKTEQSISLAIRNLLGNRVAAQAALYLDNPLDAMNSIHQYSSDLSIRQKELSSTFIALSLYRLHAVGTGHSPL